MAEMLLKDEVYAVIGAAMEVHSELGAGFLEAVYQEALEIELAQRGIPFEPQKELLILYKGRPLKKRYVADGLAYAALVVELKAQDCLTSKDDGQMINYLRATGLRVGVLINFGNPSKLEWKRLIW